MIIEQGNSGQSFWNSCVSPILYKYDPRKSVLPWGAMNGLFPSASMEAKTEEKKDLEI
jgi:hypothetical protein